MIGSLLFADDIVLLANSKEDLKFLMGVVWEYSRKWRFNFNLDKSAVVIFEKEKSLLSGDSVRKFVNVEGIGFWGWLVQELTVHKY